MLRMIFSIRPYLHIWAKEMAVVGHFFCSTFSFFYNKQYIFFSLFIYHWLPRLIYLFIYFPFLIFILSLVLYFVFFHFLISLSMTLVDLFFLSILLIPFFLLIYPLSCLTWRKRFFLSFFFLISCLCHVSFLPFLFHFFYLFFFRFFLFIYIHFSLFLFHS